MLWSTSDFMCIYWGCIINDCETWNFTSAVNSVVFSHITQYSVSKKITEMTNRSGKCSRNRENFRNFRILQDKQVVMLLIVRTSQCTELSCLYCQPEGPWWGSATRFSYSNRNFSGRNSTKQSFHFKFQISEWKVLEIVFLDLNENINLKLSDN